MRGENRGKDGGLLDKREEEGEEERVEFGEVKAQRDEEREEEEEEEERMTNGTAGLRDATLLPISPSEGQLWKRWRNELLIRREKRRGRVSSSLSWKLRNI